MDAAEHVTRIEVPTPSLVLLMGAAGAGKSTFAARHFAPTEVVSSDGCRGLVADDVNDQSATAAAFDVVHRIIHHRLSVGRFTVVDATNLTREGRRHLRDLATHHNMGVAVIVLDPGTEVLESRNAVRLERMLPVDRLRRQMAQLERAMDDLVNENLVAVHHLTSVAAIDAVTVDRVVLGADVRHRHGPFDIVGDVHGCAAELLELVSVLGYPVVETGAGPRLDHHPDGRMLVFVGDVVDRGPAVAETLSIVMMAADDGVALVVLGNHEEKLARALRGHNVRVNNGLRTSLEALATADERRRASIAGWIESLPTHLVLDDGALVVAHAGLAERFHGRRSGAERRFAVYGDVTGRTSDDGFPERRDWAAEYTGEALVVYGHTPVPEAVERNNTVCVDTGCVFGGRLSALRYPERAVVSVPAQRSWWAFKGTPVVMVPGATP